MVLPRRYTVYVKRTEPISDLCCCGIVRREVGSKQCRGCRFSDPKQLCDHHTAPVSSVALSVSATTVCNCTTASSLQQSETNGGLTPAYDWYVNGTVVLSGSTSYSGTFNDGDVLKVEMTSSDDCVSAKVVADSITINVNPLPAVTLSSQGYVCELDGPQQLSGGTPAGGIYSGTGVTNDSIFPSVAGVGSHWIYYTYADATTGCSNTKQRTMSVQPAPGKPTVSQDATTGELIAATPAGSYSYEWLDANMDPIAGATSATSHANSEWRLLREDYFKHPVFERV